MIEVRLKKVGDEHLVEIPKVVVERNGSRDGQLLTLDVTEMDHQPTLRPELKQILDEQWEAVEPGLHCLADR